MEKIKPLNPVKSDTGFFLRLFTYIVFVCAADNLYNLFVGPRISLYLQVNFFLMLVGALPKVLYWLLPSYIYLHYFEHTDALSYLKLKANLRRGIFWGTLIALLIDALILTNKYLLLRQPFNLHTLSVGEWLNVVILVGFMEEIPFRGVVFQKLHERLSFWWATILSALVFLELHLVYWLTLGKSITYLLIGSPSILLFAIISCILLKRTGSLWSSIIFHSLYDFMTLFFL